MASRSKKASAPASNNKKLQIQIGSVKRLQKDVLMYEKEAKTNADKLQKMRDEGKDEYDIKKQEEILQESYMMIPIEKDRVEKSIEDLTVLIDEISNDETIDQELLAEAKKLTSADNEGENNTA
eukprot:TRINITY_DN112365_c0_g1_i1.p1 TRINITY_DN112365_c0_g1~~TRINITY_DN112365_c0_g1_i1.p1  ORF type:complete len:124 (-),score=20.35 TRINITY_DN112365_c0_g1_i1:80-451(-)